MTEQAPSARPSKPRSLIRGIFLWVLLPLLLLLFAGLASLYTICLYKPELVTAVMQRHLSEATGMPWRIKGAIRPVLAPFPGLVLSDVNLMAATLEQIPYADTSRPLLHVGKLRLYADPVSVLRLSPRFHQVELIEPVINLAYDQHGRPLWLPLPQEETGPGASGPGEAEAGAATPSAEENGAALRRAANLVCTLPPSAMQPVLIRNGSVMSYANDNSLLLFFTGINGTFEPGAPEDNLRLSTAFSLPDAGLDLRVFLSARIGCEGIPARGKLSGRVDMTPPGSRTLSGEFSSGFLWREDGRHIALPDFRLAAETDAISGDLTLDLAETECTGKVLIHKLSLPRWFEFGRVLPPGLRQALDALEGEFDLQLDARRAEALNLSGTAGILSLSGYVGTPDFSAPVVAVDLDLDQADLDLLFPFLSAPGTVVPEPVPLAFDHPPLAPYPKNPDAPPPAPPEPGAPPDIEVSYDVTVRVARPRVHSVDTGPLRVLVFPAQVRGIEKTRVTFSVSSILDGAVNGRLDIGDHAILMHYDAKALELGLLPENAAGAVTIAGKVTGVCEMDVPLLQDGSLADDWKIRVNAAIKGCEIVGHHAPAPWRLFADTAGVDGQGNIYAVLSKGIRIQGLWALAVAGIKTSWFPKGNDALKGTFDGGLHWPPMDDAPPAGASTPAPHVIEKRGVDKVAGNLQLDGSLTVPLGSLLKPVTGKLKTDLDWRLYAETIALQNITYEGFGSYLEGRASLDFSGREVLVGSDVSFKINPRELLKAWNALPPPEMQPPQLLTGQSSVSGRSGSLRFDAIKAELDGAPVSGEIFWQDSTDGAAKEEAGQWTFRLSANFLDLDKYFPPAPALPPGQRPPPPSQKPWDLSFLKGKALDAQLLIRNAKKDRLTFGQSKITAALQRDRFSFFAGSDAFYNGKATLVLQGTIVPGNSQITLRKGLLQVDDADVGKLMYDYSKETSFGGQASLIVDVNGTMRSDADVPAKLSGIWNLRISDGLYPAFMSGQDSALRNTFSTASASGALENGVLRSRNFTLSGTMVNMEGSGWFDLTNRNYDIGVSVTFARVPTVPVRFYGSTYEPRMRVRGVDMVVETVQHAGSTVFGLFKGVLLLPAYAVGGAAELLGGGQRDNQPAKVAPLAPMRQQTGHPGQ
ncbi:MAG: hypothetical protein FWG04_04305 [Desulfovibrionaceae bacterium]|nr:hypothetical protein [Desulfovibrionaceae bacterium]